MNQKIVMRVLQAGLVVVLLGVSSRGQSTYRLDCGDVLAIAVFGLTEQADDFEVFYPDAKQAGANPGFGKPVLVASDGTISLPHLGRIEIRGFTVKQARDAINREYIAANVLKNEYAVMLSLVQKRTVRVTVLETASEGFPSKVTRLRLEPGFDQLVGAIAAARPVDPRSRVRVLKPGIHGDRVGLSGGSQNLGSIEKRDTARQERELQDGDTVLIESSPTGRFFTGGDMRNGQQTLPRRGELALLQAIASQGGTDPSRLRPWGGFFVIAPGGAGFWIPNRALYGPAAASRIQDGTTLLAR